MLFLFSQLFEPRSAGIHLALVPLGSRSGDEVTGLTNHYGAAREFVEVQKGWLLLDRHQGVVTLFTGVAPMRPVRNGRQAIEHCDESGQTRSRSIQRCFVALQAQ